MIFSSRTIPGNEKAVLDIKNGLIDQGVKVIEDRDALVHVPAIRAATNCGACMNGRGRAIGMPVHGEAAHLVAQGSLMAASGIPEVAQVRDGDMLRLAPGAAEIIDQVPFGRIYKDGRLIGDDEAMGIRDRRKLSFAGHVAVNVVLDDRNTRSPAIPTWWPSASRQPTPRGELLEELMLDAAVGAIDSIPRVRRKDIELVAEAVRRAVRGCRQRGLGQEADGHRVRHALATGSEEWLWYDRTTRMTPTK